MNTNFVKNFFTANQNKFENKIERKCVTEIGTKFLKVKENEFC